MEISNIISLIAVFVTLCLGIGTLILGIINAKSTANINRKIKSINVITAQVKEELDKVTEYSAQMLVLANIETIRQFAAKKDTSYLVKLIETDALIKTFLHRGYVSCKRVINSSAELVQMASKIFEILLNNNGANDYNVEELIEKTEIFVLEAGLYKVTQWRKLKEEAGGKTVSINRWEELREYNKGFCDEKKIIRIKVYPFDVTLNESIDYKKSNGIIEFEISDNNAEIEILTKNSKCVFKGTVYAHKWYILKKRFFKYEIKETDSFLN